MPYTSPPWQVRVTGSPIAANAGHLPRRTASISATGFLGRSEYLGDSRTYDESNIEDAVDILPHSSLSEDDLKVLAIRKAFDIPPRAVAESLIASFMERCHPWMPLVEEQSLHEFMRTGAESGGAPIQLMQAVFMAGSRANPRMFDQSETFYNRAKVLFFMGYEEDPITLIITTCLLQWWNPSGPERVSIHNSAYWLRVGVGIAQQIGLHREPDPSKHSPSDLKLRRRIWWTLCARDCLLSTGQGRPRAIHNDDCFVKAVSIEDFDGPSKEAHIFVAYVSISLILGRMTDWYLRGKKANSQKASIEADLFSWIEDLPLIIRPADSMGKLHGYDFNTRQLYLPYFTAICILYRVQPSSDTLSAAAIMASSCIVRLVEDFIARDQLRHMNAMLAIYLLVAGLGQLSCFGRPDLWTSSKRELEVVVHALEELSRTWHTAKGSLRILRRAQQIMIRHQPTQPLKLESKPEALSYFEPFSQDFCGKWGLLMPMMRNSVQHTSSTFPDIQGDFRLPDGTNMFGEDADRMTNSTVSPTANAYGNWLLEEWEDDFPYDFNNLPADAPHAG